MQVGHREAWVLSFLKYPLPEPILFSPRAVTSLLVFHCLIKHFILNVTIVFWGVAY